MMAPLDALLGWDEDSTAEAYAAFTRDFPHVRAHQPRPCRLR